MNTRAVAVAAVALWLAVPAGVQGLEPPATGQTTVFQGGDDGDLRKGVPWPTPRFRENGDGTLTDRLTGLMWMADMKCAATLGSDADGAVPWADTFALAAAVNGGADCASYSASYTDWRVPNLNEMESLESYGTFGLAWLGPHGFINAPAPTELFWTSTPEPGVCDRAYIHESFTASTTASRKVMLVRGQPTGPALVAATGVTTSCHAADDGDFQVGVPAPSPRFADNGDGTVTDRLTNLMWFRDALCAKSAAVSADGLVTWASALAFAQAANSGANLSSCAGYSADYNDWRLPNIRELRSLLDFSRKTPALPVGHPFANTPTSSPAPGYWSSTTWARDTVQALLIGSAFPVIGSQGKAGTQGIWLVRSAAAVLSDCIESSTTLCLNSGRFQVQATWQTGMGQSGQAQVVKLTEDTGYLWFFAPTNVEAVVKVLNACGFNERFWVFAGGLTDVRVVMTVTDSQTGVMRTYVNPQGRPFESIQDTDAFATCP